MHRSRELVSRTVRLRPCCAGGGHLPAGSEGAAEQEVEAEAVLGFDDVDRGAGGPSRALEPRERVEYGTLESAGHSADRVDHATVGEQPDPGRMAVVLLSGPTPTPKPLVEIPTRKGPMPPPKPIFMAGNLRGFGTTNVRFRRLESVTPAPRISRSVVDGRCPLPLAGPEQ